MQAELGTWLQKTLAVRLEGAHPVGGGCIGESFKCVTSTGLIFVKAVKASASAMLEAEAAGLAELERASAIRVPRVIAHGTYTGHALLALEWLDFTANTAHSSALLGQQLAALHRISAQQFGWSRDNTIGATPQRNAWCADWAEFWRQSRLAPQLEMAKAHGAKTKLIESGWRLYEAAPRLLDHSPCASLVHGDLWGGNWATASDGAPVIFDPAIYFGDRETDIAMTQLFGGFNRSFYKAYTAEWPLDARASVRATLYNLYHVLNHFVLFGGSYAMQAERMIEQLLAEVR
jgi:fructosamine-3-kinase